MAGSANCLIVDDEPSVRRSLARMLAAQGFNCLEAGTGKEGLEVLDQTGEIPVTLAYPDGSMTASGLRREAARGRLAIERVAGKDYTTLADLSGRFANWLVTMGIAKGERVLPVIVEVVEAMTTNDLDFFSASAVSWSELVWWR